ncbi:MAG: hypothetical protein SH808_10320 [Saprospiraceae bacterium]|nr:hypothetical protein [Saprospiraceae bacterium]
MKKKWISSMVFFWVVVSCPGQLLITSGSVLASARQDLSMDLYHQQIEYSHQTNKNLPFINEVSLRTETDRFDLNRQEYIARVSVNGFSEMYQQRLFQDSDLSAKENMQRVYWHDALIDRYLIMTSYRHIQRLLNIQLGFQQVYTDKANVLKKMAALNVGPDLDELIKAEFELDNLVLKIAEGEDLLAQLNLSIQTKMALNSTSWQLDTSDFITPSQIEVVISQLPDSAFQNPQLIEKQIKIDQFNAAYNYEKAKSNQMLDFLQVRYSNLPFNPSLERELSIGLAINLPFKGASRVNMSELAIDKNAAIQNRQLYLAELTRQVTSSKLQVEALGKRFRMATQQWQDSQGRFTLEHPENTQTDGPMTLLNARELHLKRQSNLLDIEHNIMELYLKVLDWTGQLSVEPSINYLSKDLSAY